MNSSPRTAWALDHPDGEEKHTSSVCFRRTLNLPFRTQVQATTIPALLRVYSRSTVSSLALRNLQLRFFIPDQLLIAAFSSPRIRIYLHIYTYIRIPSNVYIPRSCRPSRFTDASSLRVSLIFPAPSLFIHYLLLRDFQHPPRASPVSLFRSYEPRVSAKLSSGSANRRNFEGWLGSVARIERLSG